VIKEGTMEDRSVGDVLWLTDWLEMMIGLAGGEGERQEGRGRELKLL
jgi:hypothetical protein